MSIQETFEIDKEGKVVRFPLFKRVFLALVIVLVALLGFGIGRLSGEGRAQGVTITYDPSALEGTSSSPIGESPAPVSKAATPAVQTASVVASGQIYASSQGKRYYYPNCKSTVLDKNKVFFADAKTAEEAGYTLAANCLPQ